MPRLFLHFLEAMRITHYEHIALVCKYHSNRFNPCKPDPIWAKRTLTQYERDGLVTPDQADDIRRACGWNVDADQLPLFTPAADSGRS